jgi:hypothetical protein
VSAPTNVVTEVLRQRQGDLVFHARLFEDDDILLWFLFEHQSAEDWWMAPRIARLELAMWQQWCRAHPEARMLPAIVPVVIYHGRERWRAPTDVAELCSLTGAAREAVAGHLMRCRFVLDDLGAIDDDAIRARRLDEVGALALVALAHAMASDFVERLARRWSAELGMLLHDPESEDAQAFLLYVMHVNPRNDPETLKRNLVPAVGAEAEKAIMTAADKLIQEGYEKGVSAGLEKGMSAGLEKGMSAGLEKGRVEGRFLGQQLLLVRLLEQRFGPLPAEDAARIGAASSEELERWALRVLDAESLEAVFID